jgi:hypothetical protein
MRFCAGVIPEFGRQVDDAQIAIIQVLPNHTACFAFLFLVHAKDGPRRVKCDQVLDERKWP